MDDAIEVDENALDFSHTPSPHAYPPSRMAHLVRIISNEREDDPGAIEGKPGSQDRFSGRRNPSRGQIAALNGKLSEFKARFEQRERQSKRGPTSVTDPDARLNRKGGGKEAGLSQAARSTALSASRDAGLTARSHTTILIKLSRKSLCDRVEDG